MELISLIILGEPKAQKRHRTVRVAGFNRQYDPSENDKKDLLHVVQSNAPTEPYICPLRLIVNFYFSRPQAHYKSGKNSHILKDKAPLWHTSRPDGDNCLKLICDALNKVFWRDDSVLCEIGIRKRYSENPRIEIKISSI